MFSRILDITNESGSLFLLGPRKVGKSTYLKQAFPNSIYVDLLDNKLYLDYTLNPGKMYENIMYQIAQDQNLRNHHIIIDEIQRIPLLLNDVHRLIESEKLKFILCGSSARKLVRGGANMLGGRAGRINMWGFALKEIENIDLLKAINNGTIPSHYLETQANESIQAYVQNYIEEEIKAEALVRNLRSFHRFLELASITNTEEVNYSNIARDVGVDAKTIREYFQILVDTLVGNYLESFFDKKKRTNIRQSSKFYLFDTGVANYLKGISINKDEGAEFGKSFEQLIFSELQIYKSYTRQNFDISFWKTYEQDEVDFILGDGEVAIEVKGSKNIQSSEFKSLHKFKKIYNPKRSIVVCNESSPRLTEGGIEVLPYKEFIDRLWDGDILNV